jgi:hypothetical protein
VPAASNCVFTCAVGEFLVVKRCRVDIPAQAIAVVVEADMVTVGEAKIIAAEIGNLERRCVERSKLLVGQTSRGPALNRRRDDVVNIVEMIAADMQPERRVPVRRTRPLCPRTRNRGC